jgi:ferredoxin
MRVFRGKPEVLDYLCIDCTACIAECPTGTLGTRGTRAELGPTAGRVLVVPASVLVQFDGVPPQRVLNELAGLGFDRVRTTAAWDAALLAAARAHAAMAEGVRPVIAPGCPAVVNVVETKFPGLIPNLAPYVSALEAVRMELAGEPALYVVACPAQRTALADVETTDVILPHVLATAVGPRLAQRVDTPRDEEPRAVPNASIEDVLYVTGIRNVMRVLDAIENGQAEDVSVVDAWACTAGCFGSPLLAQEGHMARQRWAAANVPLEPTARAVPRTAPFTPRRGLRLDSDMQKAVQKLGRIDKLKRTLPGADCGQCGAPTCAALAEDIVLGRAAADACVRQQPRAPAAQEKQP